MNYNNYLRRKEFKKGGQASLDKFYTDMFENINKRVDESGNATFMDRVSGILETLLSDPGNALRYVTTKKKIIENPTDNPYGVEFFSDQQGNMKKTWMPNRIAESTTTETSRPPIIAGNFPRPTTQDSLNLYNAQIALNKFYNNEVKKGRLQKFPGRTLPSEYFKVKDFFDGLKDDNLEFYRLQISDRADRKGKGWLQTGLYDQLYKEYFNLSPEQIRDLEFEGLKKTKSGNKYQQYYRDLVTPMQNLASPFALVDIRIKPKRTISYDDPKSRYPGGAVEVFDYDPLAIKPYHLRTPQEKLEWERLYGNRSERPLIKKISNDFRPSLSTNFGAPTIAMQPSIQTNGSGNYVLRYVEYDESGNPIPREIFNNDRSVLDQMMSELIKDPRKTGNWSTQGNYEDGGSVIATTTRAPIYVSNPNDPRLKNYADSSYNYNVGQRMLNILDNDKNLIKVSPKSPIYKNIQKHKNKFNDNTSYTNTGYKNYDKISAIMTEYQKKGNKGILPIGIQPYWPDPGNFAKDLVTLRSLWDAIGVTDPRPGVANIPFWQKPVQPVIYRKEEGKPPVQKTKIPSTKKIVEKEKETPQIKLKMVTNERVDITPSFTVRPPSDIKIKRDYSGMNRMVEYFDPSIPGGVNGGWHRRLFPTIEEADKFMSTQPMLGPSMTNRAILDESDRKEFEQGGQYEELDKSEMTEGEMEEMKMGGGIPERYKNMGFTKVGVKKQSNRPGKKWMVLAKKGDQYKVVHGGYKGMKDYTQHGSEERRQRFWDRMGGKNSSKAKNPFSPLYWHKRFGTW